jgi:tetratricopeptide (TPR) repeat protein
VAEELKAYKVFIATPSGLERERKAFRDVISAYNEIDANHRGAHFIPIGWEITLGGIGRPQALINEQVRKCDYFVLVLWDRWGSPPSPEGQGKYTSGTEEEYGVAWECFEDKAKPMRQIVAFFRAVDPRQFSDPGDQLKKVLDFKRTLENKKILMFDTFDELKVFEDKLRCYLAQWVRDHEAGQTTKVASPVEAPRPSAEPQGATVAPKSPDVLTHVQNAWRLVEQGRLTDAETEFTQAVACSESVAALNEYGVFLMRIGRSRQAEAVFRRVRELSLMSGDQEGEAIAHGNLGLLFQRRGDQSQAEQLFRKALEIYLQIGDKEGVANQYTGLGETLRMKGALPEAQAVLEKALEIYRHLGNQHGLATLYGNLGNIAFTRCDFARAEQMYRNAEEVYEGVDDQDGLASVCGNLGLVYYTRGELSEAEKMFRKALDIHERVGNQQNAAASYANLGNVFGKRGDNDQAEIMFLKALGIEERIGDLRGVAGNYGNIGIVLRSRGDLGKAEEMHRKAIEIDERLGNELGAAEDYMNLGNVLVDRNDFEQARTMFTTARDIFSRAGIPEKVHQVQRSLDLLDRKSAER